jgi:hypothetical protein
MNRLSYRLYTRLHRPVKFRFCRLACYFLMKLSKTCSVVVNRGFPKSGTRIAGAEADEAHLNSFRAMSIYKESGELNRYSDRLCVGRPGFDSQNDKLFLFSTVSRPTMRTTYPPLHWVPGPLPRG